MKKLLIGLAVVGIFLTGCEKKEAPPKPAIEETQGTTQVTIPASDAVMVQEKIYEGVLPCADCSGIKTRVKMMGKEGDATANLFELTRTYLGKEPNNINITSGNYVIKQGMEGDSTATLYIFNPNKSKDEQEYFAIYSNDPGTMYQLDRDMKKIESDLNYSLKLNN